MTSRDFCFWLQGYFEIDSALDPDITNGLPAEKVRIIKDHLQLVFEKVTPDRNPEIKSESWSHLTDQYQGSSEPGSVIPTMGISCSAEPAGFVSPRESGPMDRLLEFGKPPQDLSVLEEIVPEEDQEEIKRLAVEAVKKLKIGQGKTYGRYSAGVRLSRCGCSRRYC